jgi:Peptidase of plants and bacteria
MRRFSILRPAVALPCIVLFVLAFVDGGQVKSADPPRPLHVTVDVSEVPELKEWSDKARDLVILWHPRIAKLLASDGFTAPRQVKLVFKKGKRGIAATSGTTITITGNWVKKHPDDFGMVIHELTHVVQAYPSYRDGWLVEGIADYVRFFHFEPKASIGPINPDKASYRDGYRTTARFLAWIEKTYDKAIVSKLNQALRTSKYQESLFRDYTGKRLEELWVDFVRSLRQ